MENTTIAAGYSKLPPVGQLLNLAWSEAGQRYKVMLPLSLAGTLATAAAFGVGFGLYTAVQSQALTLVYAIIAAVLVMAVSVVAEAGNIYASLHEPGKANFAELMKVGTAYASAIFFIGLLYGLGTGLGLVLLVVPGVWFALTYGFAFFTAVDEKLGARAAMQRSKELTTGYKLQLLKRIFVVLVIYVIIGTVFDYVFGSFLPEWKFMDKYQFQYGSIVQTLLTPWYFMYCALMYKSLKLARTSTLPVA